MGAFTDYYRVVDSCVTFRYDRCVTVPGKGGRPRKWRSDTDRVRAFRARQKGEDEPTTIDIALAEGDEAAGAWERVRELGEAIQEQRLEIKTLKSSLRRAEKDLDKERIRLGWIEQANDRLRAEIQSLTNEGAGLHQQLDDPHGLDSTSAVPPSQPSFSSQNRAQRREAEREHRRRSRGGPA